MNVSLFIKNGLIVDPASDREYTADLRIKDGEIVEIGQSLKHGPDESLLDASGLWITPGFIDLHCHLREIGQSDKEDIETGTRAAAAGGFTCVLAMANTDPPIDNSAILSLLLNKIDAKALIEVLPAACVTKRMEGAELVNMVELAEMGVAAFSDDGLPLTNLAVLRRALEYAKLADRPIISHAEDKDLSAGGVIHEGLKAISLGLPGIPGASESAAIAREIEVAREVDGRLHFAHVSCAASVELIRQAKAAGLSITADATAHHICLSVEDINGFETNYKMNPPLRAPADQAALIAGLKDGTIDAIATDHAPHTALEKSLTFDLAPFGVIGLETAFPVTLEKLMRGSGMSKLSLVALFSAKPAAVLGLPQPTIKPATPANMAIIDPEHQWIYDARKGFSKSANSPFSGRRLRGKVLATFSQGSAVFKDEELIGPRIEPVACRGGS